MMTNPVWRVTRKMRSAHKALVELPKLFRVGIVVKLGGNQIYEYMLRIIFSASVGSLTLALIVVFLTTTKGLRFILEMLISVHYQSSLGDSPLKPESVKEVYEFEFQIQSNVDMCPHSSLVTATCLMECVNHMPMWKSNATHLKLKLSRVLT